MGRVLKWVIAAILLLPITVFALVEVGGYNIFPGLIVKGPPSGQMALGVEAGRRIFLNYPTNTIGLTTSGSSAFFTSDLGTTAINMSGALTVGTGGNAITKSHAPTATTIDFASITTTCADSSSITVTGAVVGDACSVGPPATSATGSIFSCRVTATNTAVVRHCSLGTNDPASGSYYVRTFSQQ